MINFFKKKKILVTHRGTFHTDDLFATAVLYILLDGKIKLKRVGHEDLSNIKTDYIYDIGGVYDPRARRFDHHQKDAPVRDNGIPYAALGLVWKEYGETICGDKRVAYRIEQKIVMPIDAKDNGVDICRSIFEGVLPYDVGLIFKSEIPTWKENNENTDTIFYKQVLKIVELLRREIKIAKDDIEGMEIILDSYKKSDNKKIIILDKNISRYLYQEVLSSLPEPIYVVLPDTRGNNWKTEAVKKDIDNSESRKPFPENWRGEMDIEKLRNVSGLDGIFFCHKDGFLTISTSKESAIKLAEKALIA